MHTHRVPAHSLTWHTWPITDRQTTHSWTDRSTLVRPSFHPHDARSVKSIDSEKSKNAGTGNEYRVFHFPSQISVALWIVDRSLSHSFSHIRAVKNAVHTQNFCAFFFFNLSSKTCNSILCRSDEHRILVLLSLTPHLVLRTVTVSQTENRAEIVNFNESQTAMVTNLMIMSNKIYNFICFLNWIAGS